MSARLHRLGEAIRHRFGLWLAITLAFPVLFHAAMLAALLIRFQAWPNYAEAYDWLGSVATILRSTPALSDVWPIIAEEWLLEIGRMNYAYGNGISEWSLNVVPAKLAVLLVLAAGIASVVVLGLAQRGRCTATTLRGAGASGGLGAVLVGMTSVTLSWVVCCATPNWVVGLAIMGLGVSASLWLEQFGPWIGWSGFAFLLVAIYWFSGEGEAAAGDTHPGATIIGATK